MKLSTVNAVKSDCIVTSFRANRENWKRLKVLATVDGIPIQDKLNELIESYLDRNYAKSLGLEQNIANDSTEEE
tara:strand:- start:39 stop:260 length:222 start_codon:yes stop_codon:yes gene_type:complete